MAMTFLLSVIMMAGLFLMLYSGVGLIQDKRFFTSAPLEVQNAVTNHSERFKGAHALGWVLTAVSVGMLVGAPVYACYDGLRNGYSFMQIFVRLLIMLWGLKAFDIIVFDWILLCNSGFFPHFYPEVKEVQLAQGAKVSTDSLSLTKSMFVMIKTDSLFSTTQQERLEQWLKTRLDTEEMTLIINN
jgi:hypothetical protein